MSITKNYYSINEIFRGSLIAFNDQVYDSKEKALKELEKERKAGKDYFKTCKVYNINKLIEKFPKHQNYFKFKINSFK